MHKRQHRFKDKSLKNSNFRSDSRNGIAVRSHYLLVASFNNLSPIMLSNLLFIILTLARLRVLLFVSGIEQNPGPVSVSDRDNNFTFSVLSQNCRGLTDRNKLISIIRKIYPRTKSVEPVIACLQETHRIDRFAAENLFRGSLVVDDGERNQRGVCILIPEPLTLCKSSVSGDGRWAMATVAIGNSQVLAQAQAQAQQLPSFSRKLLIVTVYAPNCYREATGFYQDLFDRVDEEMAALVAENESFETLVLGDFNVVLDQGIGQANRNSTQAEKDLASRVKSAMQGRDLVEHDSLSKENCFTWRRGLCLSKLDYIFMSRSLCQAVQSASIKWHELGANLDHATVRAKLAIGRSTQRGRSFPKLFSTDLRGETSISWLSEQLNSSKGRCQRIGPHT